MSHTFHAHCDLDDDDAAFTVISIYAFLGIFEAYRSPF